MAISALSVKITIPVALISALAIGLTTFLNLGKFERTYSDLESARIRFIVNDLRENLETGLDLGLPLASLDNAQTIINAAVDKDHGILSVTVFDDTRKPVFHTGRKLAAQNTDRWPDATANESSSNWQLTQPDALLFGSRLSSSIGGTAGTLVLRYSLAEHNRLSASVSHCLKLAAVGAILLTTLATVVGLNLLLAGTNRRLGVIEAALSQPGVALPLPGNEPSDGVKAVLHTSQAALSELESLRRGPKTGEAS